jgi:hypothetical protein
VDLIPTQDEPEGSGMLEMNFGGLARVVGGGCLPISTLLAVQMTGGG